MTTALTVDLTVFVLAVLVGFEVISKVPATLHTPLMSGANSIHGVVLIGANWIVMAAAGLAGAVAGAAEARAIKMTAMPQLVSVFNAAGGGAAALLAVNDILASHPDRLSNLALITGVLDIAIHPVAGRMPGHMNVLLAEANVPYPQLKEMDEINPQFSQADVALVVGANDVTNPAARRPGGPLSGMPILDVDHARSVIVLKRSLGHGYAGVDNELYTNPKTAMFFSDAKQGLASLLTAVKTLVA